MAGQRYWLTKYSNKKSTVKFHNMATFHITISSSDMYDDIDIWSQHAYLPSQGLTDKTSLKLVFVEEQNC